MGEAAEGQVDGLEEATNGMSSRHHRRGSGRIGRKLRRFRLFRIFRKDRAFAYAFVLGIGMVGLLLLSIPRLIRTTPPDFPLGEVRVSVVDLAQAWSLARAARRAEAEGDLDSALQAWRSASANNPGDPEIHRGSLRFLRGQARAPYGDAAYANHLATWLTALSPGSVEDRLLAAEVLEKYSLSTRALELLEASPSGTGDAVDRARARSLLASGQHGAFEPLWRTNHVAWGSDPAMAPYLAAWDMMRDGGSTGLEAGLRLKEAAADKGAGGLVAARLLHQAGVRRGLVEEVNLGLQRMVEGGSSTVVQHAQFWQLLLRSGREEEARAYARVFKDTPRDAASAQLLVETMKQLGLREEALRFLERSVGDYGTAVPVWRVYFDLVVEAGSWNEVRRLTANARVLCSRQDALYGETLFADYRAAQGTGRTNDAAQVVRELIDLRSPDVTGVIRVAGRLRDDGRSSQALAVLRNHEAAFAGSGPFWGEYFQVGRVLKDVSLLRRAVGELLRLQPRSAMWANNRAALLLITGENPAEALQLTFEGLQKQPESAAFRINHAIALFMNGRVNEAARQLEGLDAKRLEPDAATSYHLLLAEIRGAEGRWDEAGRTAGRVDRSLLFPHQVERLEQVLKKAGAPGAGGA